MRDTTSVNAFRSPASPVARRGDGLRDHPQRRLDHVQRPAARATDAEELGELQVALLSSDAPRMAGRGVEHDRGVGERDRLGVPVPLSVSLLVTVPRLNVTRPPRRS